MSKIKKLVPVAISITAISLLLLSAYTASQFGAQNEWQNLTLRGSNALRAGQDKLAQTYFTQALQKAESENENPNEEELIVSLQNLGICRERAGRYDDAARLYMRMAMIAKGKYGAGSQEYHEALAVLKQCSPRSPLLQKCPFFRTDEHDYTEI